MQPRCVKGEGCKSAQDLQLDECFLRQRSFWGFDDEVEACSARIWPIPVERRSYGDKGLKGSARNVAGMEKVEGQSGEMGNGECGSALCSATQLI
jgi:hypothetical protein